MKEWHLIVLALIVLTASIAFILTYIDRKSNEAFDEIMQDYMQDYMKESQQDYIGEVDPEDVEINGTPV